MKKTELSSAFTLSEVLVALVIIGVIAALTIPLLISRSQKKELISAWKNDYSIISSAMSMMKNDNGGTFKGLVVTQGDADEFLDKMSQQLKSIKKCYVSEEGCWLNSYTNLQGESSTMFGVDDGSDTIWNSGLVLSNGSLIRFLMSDDSDVCTDSLGGRDDVCGWIAVDVNGTKKPNSIGKDIFWILIASDRIVPYGSGTNDIDCDETYEYDSGEYCGAYYLMNDAAE